MNSQESIRALPDYLFPPFPTPKYFFSNFQARNDPYNLKSLITIILLQLRQKIASATSAIKSVFGQEETRQNAVRFMPGVSIAFSFILIVHHLLYLYCVG